MKKIKKQWWYSKKQIPYFVLIIILIGGASAIFLRLPTKITTSDSQDCKGTVRQETIGNVYVNGTKKGEVVMRFLDANMMSYFDSSYGQNNWNINGTFVNTFCDV